MVARKKEQVILIPKPDFRRIELKVVGIKGNSLITHKFSEKAKKMMQDKQAGKATKGRENRDPHADYCGSMYWLDKDGKEMKAGTDPSKHKTGFGFPSVGFKASAVRAGKEHLKIDMTHSRSIFHVEGEFVKIEGCKPRMRTDTVTIGQGTTDLRYRGEFVNWKATLSIKYNALAMTAEQIMNLFVYAGFGVGVGEYRTDKKGDRGQFEVA